MAAHPPKDTADRAEESSTRSNFIRDIIDADLASGKHTEVVTRFPPEPNGYLHIGHAKSICLNFGLALNYQGRCHLRFDDTNPTKEDTEYVDAIKRDIAWLGFDWGEHLYFASDYFERMYDYAVKLIKDGKAYVDSLSAEEIREYRGNFNEAGKNSPHRDRSVEENLQLFADMRAGKYKDGEHVLRAKIDMSASNIVMRDPALYRIRHAHHHRTGDAWCIYPMYDFAHCLEDAIEEITHSICTLEFENNRELYDWVLDEVGTPCHPQQIEFARLNLDYTMMSKRYLLKLVEDKFVAGWDDPRMPTIAGLRRRGITPAAIRNFSTMVGVAKNNSVVDIDKLNFCIRDDLNREAPRAMCVLRPIKVVLTNFDENTEESLTAPSFPPDVDKPGTRNFAMHRELYIDRSDFAEEPPKGWHRLAPGKEVRLRYSYVIRCDEVIKDEDGSIVELRCSYDPETLGKAPEGRKVKGAIHWVSAKDSIVAEVRLYDNLFLTERPGSNPDLSLEEELNPHSLEVLTECRVEPSIATDPAGSHYQFERHGYFFSDPVDSSTTNLVFNRTIGLRDSWNKKSQAKAEAPKAAKNAKSKTQRKREQAAAQGKGDSKPKVNEREVKRAELPELAAKYKHFIDTLKLSQDEADLLAGDLALATFFEEAVAAHKSPSSVAKWTINEVMRETKERPITDLPFGGKAFGALVALVDGNKISATAGKEVFGVMVEEGGAPDAIVEARGLAQVDDNAALEALINQVMSDNADAVQRYRDGKTQLLGFFVGQVMKASQGKANPALVRELLPSQLQG